jgi:hypothetical protein
MDPIKLQGQETSIMFCTVEDVNDPEQLNRVRCRAPIHGSARQTPTNMLPWATVMSPSMGAGPNQGGGGGQGGLSVAKGATVMALINHDNHENMTILGVLPVNNSGKNIVGASAGGQSSMALGGLKDGLTGGKHDPQTDMSKLILKDAPASFPQIKGKYPDTHINVSKSGMRNILHDVGGETYQASVHPTGTFTEMQADGNYVTYTAKDRKEAVDGSYTLGSEGNLVIATNGNLQFKVKGRMLVEVQGSYEEFTVGKRRMLSGENIDVGAKGQVDIIGEKAAGIESPGTTFVTGGSTVELNKASRKSAVPGISASNPTASEMKDNIEKGTYAKPLQEKK